MSLATGSEHCSQHIHYACLLFKIFIFFFSKKYKATAQMYRLKRCTNYIKKPTQTTDLIVKKNPAFVTEVNSFYFIFLLILRDIGKKITLHNLYSKLPSDLLTLWMMV